MFHQPPQPKAAIALLVTLLACLGCVDANPPPGIDTAPRPVEIDLTDPHSFARPQEVAVTHLDLDLTVNFETRRVEGQARLTLYNRSGANALYLDSDGLEIRGVTLDPGGRETSHYLGLEEPHLGRPLVIDISPDVEVVQIDYASDPAAAALQWLEPELTAGKRRPFLLSQSQPIFARSWIPCQDTPSVRMTYDAKLRVPPGMLALMSAENPTSTLPDGVYTFRMPQPVPAYLLALAVGEMEFRPLGVRSGIYAETPLIERAAWEFAETEKMIDSVEELYGPYRWGRYDLVVLPSSFPFGGMENPRLTFITPTAIAGDRSLVALVAHELAHSWSGNLVTNANWNEFWLNEGFTVYLERRTMERLYGREYAEMLAVLGRQDLEQAFRDLPVADTRLQIDLAGRNPDDGFTDVAYEKGYLFLRSLEQRFGRESWDRFLRDYFDRFAFQPMTTDRFVAYLRERLVERGEQVETLERQLELDAWIHEPHLPDDAPLVVSSALGRVDAQLEAWSSGLAVAELDTAGWTTHHWLHFVRNLPAGHEARLAELDRAFDLSNSGNSEILHAWLMQAIARDYAAAYPALERFLTGMGRRKFLQPLYAALNETPDGRERALRIYSRARAGYHPLSAGTVDQILAWPQGKP